MIYLHKIGKHLTDWNKFHVFHIFVFDQFVAIRQALEFVGNLFSEDIVQFMLDSKNK